MTKKTCCAPPRAPVTGATQPDGTASDALREHLDKHLIPLPGGSFRMGTDHPRYAEDMDAPPRMVTVAPFRLSAISVTNRAFARFIAESGYVTTAEREGWSFVFHTALPDGSAELRGPVQAPWWRETPGATWSAPFGPDSTVRDRMDHPVVHVSFYDALAFCAFTKTRLPTEEEWEYAARAGLDGQPFPWGAATDGPHRHNTFQGEFPRHDNAEDGFAGTAPVQSFAPNGWGFYNMTGNVWEWVTADDRVPPGDLRVIRGGSHLCHPSYCERYFVHSRTFNTPDSSTGHMGFRIAV